MAMTIQLGGNQDLLALMGAYCSAPDGFKSLL